MTIGSLSSLNSPTPAVPNTGGTGAGRERAAAQGEPARRNPRAEPVKRSADPDPRVKSDAELEELKALAAHARLELRVRELEKSNVVLIRIVDPNTGEVVREFPPQRLAKVLAELRARAAEHLDQKA